MTRRNTTSMIEASEFRSVVMPGRLALGLAQTTKKVAKQMSSPGGQQ